MDQIVSKERTKKTKKRHKKAGLSNAPSVAVLNRPFVGLIIAAVVWLISVFGLRAKVLLRQEATPEVLLPLAGDAVFALVGLFCVALFLNIVSPRHLRRNSRIVLLSVTCLLSIGLAAVIQYAAQTLALIPPETAQFVLPFALAPLLSTILIGGRAGLAAGTWTSLVIALHWDRSFAIFMTGLVATAVASQSASRVRTRTKVMKLSLVVGLAQIICVLGVTAVDWNRPDVMPVLHRALACLTGGLLSALIALLILPLFEHTFAITTDITLLEFSDLGHPLLQRLAIEAPGTYHHSLVVANLAQAAAEAIDANGLEARVCSYFHDIGKLTKPGFFTENIHMQQNPHDDLPPSMSTLVITAHVKEGLSLAMLNKLPEPVLRAIREHHGSSMLKYFHHKAKTQLEFEIEATEGGGSSGATRVDEGAFRYQGPRPSTRVSAIICLADAVEAASRSLEKTSPGHIEGLVGDIIRMRLDDGQLDDCELTMQELTKVRRAFVFTLTTMLHGRIPYPKDDDKDKQPPKTSTRERPANRGTNDVADEPSA
jgi:putative nucleotidyltransferase with HDIG domain